MRLVRLLAAGKSVVGMSDEASPYRLTGQRLLPKFGPVKKNPPGRGQNRAVIARVVAPPSAPKAATPPRPAPPVAASAPAAAPRAPWLARTCRWLAGGLRRSAGKSQPRPAAQRPSPPVRPAVQGELLLEHVKVVRNDLSDSDFELAQLRPRSAPAGEVGMGKRAQPRLAAVRGLIALFGADRGA